MRETSQSSRSDSQGRRVNPGVIPLSWTLRDCNLLYLSSKSRRVKCASRLFQSRSCVAWSSCSSVALLRQDLLTSDGLQSFLLVGVDLQDLRQLKYLEDFQKMG